MARPQRNDVDYFPFYCKEGKAMFIIESQYGNDGYATWVKLLRLFAVTNYHYLNLQSETELLFVASKCRVSKEVLLKIINTLVDIGEFDADLWEQKIVWSEKFVDSIKDAYLKRGNETMKKVEFTQFLGALGVLKQGKSTLLPTNYTILNNTKEDNTKVKDIEARKADFKEAVKTHLSDAYKLELLKSFFEYWSEHNEDGKLMRFEMKKNQPFNIKRRLSTWKNNELKFKKDGSNNKNNSTTVIGHKDYSKGL